uniref:Uncharacterized protein n=1 Tax=Anguilla anguilla TaxID=7936 RepID=A0A0E9VCU3_ANGAN
MQHMEFVIK